MTSRSGKFWSAALGVLSMPVAVTAGVVRGGYNQVGGNGTFREGYNDTVDTVIDVACEFGEEQGETITSTVIGVAGKMAGAKAADHIKHRHDQ